MAETIAEVFIRLGTQGVGDAAKQITSVNTALDSLKQSAQLAFAAMNPSITQKITSEQARLRQEFDAGSISIREYVEGLREVQNASRVLTATFDQRESMAKGLLSKFVGGDQQAEVAQLRRVITELQSAGNLSDVEAGQISAGIDYEQQQRQMRALEQVSREMNQGIAASRQSAVDRAIAASDAEIDAELRKTRIAVDGARARERAEQEAAATATAELAKIAAATDAEDRKNKEIADFQARLKRNSLNLEQRRQDKESKEADKVGASFLKEEVAKANAAALREENTNRLRALEITRRNETAQETFNRKIAEYNMLRRQGAISEETFNRAVASSNRELQHNIRLHELGKKGILGNQQALMQLSYGLQDIAIVADQGFGRAMQASANNLSMVIPYLVKSTGLGIGLSVGFTAAATAITMFERSLNNGKTASEQMTDAVAKLREELEKLQSSMKEQFSVDRLIKTGSTEQVRREIESKKEDYSVQVAVNKRSEENAQRLGREVLASKGLAIDPRTNLFSEMGVNQIGQSIAARRKAMGIAPLSAKDEEDEARRIQSEIRTNPLVAAAIESWGASHEAAVEIQKSIESLEKEGLPAAQERDAKEFTAKEREQDQRDRMQQQQESASARKEMLKVLDPAAGRSQEVYDKLRERIDIISRSDFLTESQQNDAVASVRDVFNKELDSLVPKEKSRFNPSFSGFSDFGRQFQMALFQDPAEKDRKEQIRLQQEANDAIRQIAPDVVAGLGQGAVAVFAGGSQ